MRTLSRDDEYAVGADVALIDPIEEDDGVILAIEGRRALVQWSHTTATWAWFDFLEIIPRGRRMRLARVITAQEPRRDHAARSSRRRSARRSTWSPTYARSPRTA